MEVTFNFRDSESLRNVELVSDQHQDNLALSPRTQEPGAFDHDLTAEVFPGKAPEWDLRINKLPAQYRFPEYATHLIRNHKVNKILIKYFPEKGIHENAKDADGLNVKAINLMDPLDVPDHILIIDADTRLHTKEIIYIHGNDSLTCIHTLSKHFRLKTGLADLTDLFMHPYLIRVNPCCTINASFLHAFNEKELYLKNSDQIVTISLEVQSGSESLSCKMLAPEYIMSFLLANIDPEWQEWLLKVEAIMVNEVKKGILSIANVADEMGMCTRQFQRIFVHHTGMNPKAFAKEVRLTLVKQELIESGRLSTESISNKFGYKDIHYFKKQFKERFGYYPEIDIPTDVAS